MEIVNAFFVRFFAALMGNIFVRLLLIVVCADMVFGSLRAAKYRAWNSAVGIDGAIRKAGMLACVLLFTAVDMMMHIDVLGWLPVDCSFGGSGYRHGSQLRWRFYFGNLDPWRMVANRSYYAPFSPLKRFARCDPYDNQRGEIETDTRGLGAGEFRTRYEMIDHQETEE